MLMWDILTSTGPRALLPPGLVCVYTEIMMVSVRTIRLEVGLR